MMIHGLSFLSLSASVVLPWALTGLVQGQKITGSAIRDVPQSSSVPEKTLPNRKLIGAVPTGTKYYVSGSGSDKNNGLSTKYPFRTIQRAANLTNPGDTVFIMNGVYKNSHPSGVVLGITRSGTPDAWITYTAYPGDSPKIQHNGWHGILITDGAAYIEVNGLEVVGNNNNTNLDYAMSQRSNASNPLTNGNCITISGRGRGHTHHIRILNNKVHDCGGAGIGALESDYLTLDNNEVYNNAWYAVYGCSGISLLNNWNYNNNTDSYRMVLTRNKVYNNRMYIPWFKNGKIEDGNGIIVDRARNDQAGSKLSAYQGRILIANNITYKNGGGGIHTFKSDHIDIINNTSYQNSQSPEILYGQISINDGKNVRVLNNILYSQRGVPINYNPSKNTNTVFNYNIYNNNGYTANRPGPNDIVADPQFVNAPGGDFRVKSTSPAINSGVRFPSVTNDFLGGPRVEGLAPDRGAYENQ
ncbi:choice-of-anchor Q domain-containing protein [Nostoc sp. C117]|uniref:choice-of-anchor Q domain-containing protein n=1 Tax=Nostoc sp. C117 TaxID=3349875 RepID=UPI00370D8683